MRMFKGFTKDMKCRDFQYEEGKTYEEPEAKLCDKGFHACEDPIDCLSYYPPAVSKFHEVDLDEVSEEISSEDSKRVGRRITIGAEINFMNIAKAHIQYVNEKVIEAVEKGNAEAISVGDYQKATVGDSGVANAGYSGVANAGNRGVANAGYSGVANAGYSGVANAGDSGVANAGYSGVANAGNRGVANAGNRGVANAGYSGVANAGNRGVANAGNRGVAVSRGSSKSGENGISVVRGNDVKAKGELGALLVVAEEYDYDYAIKSYAVGIVDGEIIKADTWYKCVDGKLVEVQ